MKTINLREYNISRDELSEWCKKTGAEVFAVVHYGGNGPSLNYGFEKDEDLIAFKLKFKPSNNLIVGYKGVTSLDDVYFYAPYIPLLKL